MRCRAGMPPCGWLMNENSERPACSTGDRGTGAENTRGMAGLGATREAREGSSSFRGRGSINKIPGWESKG